MLAATLHSRIAFLRPFTTFIVITFLVVPGRNGEGDTVRH